MKKYKTILAICIGALFSAGNAASAQSLTFAYTGAMQTWTVPCNVTSVTIDCYGAQGLNKPQENHTGFGGEARGVMSVSGGQVLNLFVGGQAAWNGGGVGQDGANGGDASDVRFNGTGLSNRIIVAGGGGGSGGDNWGCLSGVTGNGGGGTPVGSNFVGGGGGLGYGGCGTNGGVNGGSGNASNCHGGGGGGGGQTTGGAPATATCGPFKSDSGEFGQGGSVYIAPLCTSDGEGVGAGGGGYYGGGGACGYNCGGGEGGGGSSWTGTLANPYFNQGVWTGNGQIIITYNSVNVPVTDTGVVMVNESSCNQKIGEARAKATGPALSYLWSPGGQTRDTAFNLGAGTYTIMVSNPCGNSASSTVTITQPVNAITASASVLVNAFCAGVKDGSATASGIGVGTPYTYSWNPSGETTAVANNLGAATYTVTVTNACAATASATVTITQPAPLVITAQTTASIPCFGEKVGSTYSIPGVGTGTPPYRFNWTPSGGTLDTAVGLGAGTYTITLMDNNGCTGSAKTTVTQPAAALTISASTLTNVLCNGYGTGSALSTTAGGTSPYIYSWTGGQTNANPTGLKSGIYIVDVKDAQGCSASATTTISQPTRVNVLENSTLDSGHCTGSAWVVVTGGNVPYTYAWSNGNTSYSILGQCGTGKYCCIVTDNFGCQDTACIEIYSVAGVANVNGASGKIEIYPNPTSGQLTITSTIANDNSVVEIYNVLGERVYSTSLNANKGGATTINIANQPNGIYLYRVMSGENGTLEGQGKIVLTK